MVEQDRYHPHQPKGIESKYGGAAEIKEVTDEVTGELVSLGKVEKVVLEGEGKSDQKPRRTVFLTPENRARLLKLAGNPKDENPVIPEYLLKVLREDIARGEET